jgi:hypothetical protein
LIRRRKSQFTDAVYIVTIDKGQEAETRINMQNECRPKTSKALSASVLHSLYGSLRQHHAPCFPLVSDGCTLLNIQSTLPFSGTGKQSHLAQHTFSFVSHSIKR